MGSLRDREVACSASDRQGSNFESCVWRTVSSHSSHHPQEVFLAQFILYVHKGGLKPDSYHFIFSCPRFTPCTPKNVYYMQQMEAFKKTFGTRMDTLTIMGRRCTHMMIVANITRPIFGIDIFSDGDGKVVVIDAAHRCLRDRDTFVQQIHHKTQLFPESQERICGK